MKIQYKPQDDFLRLLRSKVDLYFRLTGRSPRDCPEMYLKTLVVLGAFLGFYFLLVFVSTAWWQAVPLSILLGLAVAAVGFNVQHDGGHQAYSRHGWVNRLAALSLDLVGVSSVVWARKHALHHTYPNLDGHDKDIDLGPAVRLSPRHKRLWFHRFQHLYLWALYPLALAKWQFLDDFLDVARGRIGHHRFLRPRGWALVQFLFGKAAFGFLAFVLPGLYHPFGAVLACFALTCATAGIVSSLVNQVAHIVEEAQFPDPDPTGRLRTPWAIHQLRTTVDWARGNRAVSWYVGGLNFQIEHHLFPRICHVHYPKISRIVERECRKAGIGYHAFPTVRAALRSHYRLLKAMGSPER